MLIVEANFMEYQKLWIGLKTAVLQHKVGQVFIYSSNVSENSTVMMALPEDGAEERRNASEY
jgi:hypothetical protein